MPIEVMSHEHALEYIGWSYAPPYEFYNIPPTGFEEALEEIQGDNGMDFYSVLDEDGALFGMYEYSFSDEIMEIGLGIRPDKCGRGHGKNFVMRCISFGREKYSYAGVIRLKVAQFNARAMHLYRSIGFKEVGREEALSFGAPVVFIVMDLVDDISA